MALLDDAPRTLRDPEAVALRRAMLTEPHVAPLARYLQALRAQHPTWEFQDFDPMDGACTGTCCSCSKSPGP